MTLFEIISTIGITLLGTLLGFLHNLEKAILDKLEAQNNERLKQIDASKEDRRVLDKRISVVEESIKLSHNRINDLSIKLDKLREKIK